MLQQWHSRFGSCLLSLLAIAIASPAVTHLLVTSADYLPTGADIALFGMMTSFATFVLLWRRWRQLRAKRCITTAQCRVDRAELCFTTMVFQIVGNMESIDEYSCQSIPQLFITNKPTYKIACFRTAFLRGVVPVNMLQATS